jgi:hypothetical protein
MEALEFGRIPGFTMTGLHEIKEHIPLALGLSPIFSAHLELVQQKGLNPLRIPTLTKMSLQENFDKRDKLYGEKVFYRENFPCYLT